jgi:hypothetical protein
LSAIQRRRPPASRNRSLPTDRLTSLSGVCRRLIRAASRNRTVRSGRPTSPKDRLTGEPSQKQHPFCRPTRRLGTHQQHPARAASARSSTVAIRWKADRVRSRAANVGSRSADRRLETVRVKSRAGGVSPPCVITERFSSRKHSSATANACAIKSGGRQPPVRNYGTFFKSQTSICNGERLCSQERGGVSPPWCRTR